MYKSAPVGCLIASGEAKLKQLRLSRSVGHYINLIMYVRGTYHLLIASNIDSNHVQGSKAII